MSATGSRRVAMSAGASAGDDRVFALVGGERREQLAGQLLLLRKGLQAGLRPGRDDRRVGAEELRCPGDVVLRDREVQAQVVTADVHGPRAELVGDAEEPEPVVLRVATLPGAVAALALDLAQRRLQLHDRPGRVRARAGQPGLEHLHRQHALPLVHVGEGQPWPRAGQVGELVRVGAVEGRQDLPTLVGVQRLPPGLGALGDGSRQGGGEARRTHGGQLTTVVRPHGPSRACPAILAR